MNQQADLGVKNDISLVIYRQIKYLQTCQHITKDIRLEGLIRTEETFWRIMELRS